MTKQCSHHYGDGCPDCEIERLQMEVKIARDAQERAELPYRQAVTECQRLQEDVMAIANEHVNEVERLRAEIDTLRTLRAAWEKRAYHSESNESRYRDLLQQWLKTSERFSFLANDTRAALSGDSPLPVEPGANEVVVYDEVRPITPEQWAALKVTSSPIAVPFGVKPVNITAGPCALCGRTDRGPSSVILNGCADYIERLRSLLGKYPERAKLCDDGHPPIIHFDECPICWIDADDLESPVKSSAPQGRYVHHDRMTWTDEQGVVHTKEVTSESPCEHGNIGPCPLCLA